MGIDIKKVFGATPKTAFEASDLAIKAQQELLEALLIMQSIIDNPKEMDFHNSQIVKFINKFSDETITTG